MAKISIIEGKNKGESFELIVGETFIGRENTNQITVNDSSVSRRHCVITNIDNEFSVNDLGSLNDTFVNGKAARDHALFDGDKIQIGDFVFLFQADSSQHLPLSSAVSFDKSQLDLSKTIKISFEEAVRTMARDLASLIKISAKINSLGSVETLQSELLREIFEVIPAQEGGILLVDENDDVDEVFGLHRLSENKEIIISQTILKQVLSEKTSILINDVEFDQNLAQAESLFVSKTSSVLCVPLILFDNNIGVIYLTTRESKTPFDESHLRFLTAVAGISSVAIENVKNIQYLERENSRLRQEFYFSTNLLGESKAMKKVSAFISKVAVSDSTVLITGESGTGKELAARSIHLSGRRSEKPFIAINCAALNENLLESELFGHERGAFTGAINQKRGKIELADGGSLFLDEIGEMSLALQAKLLRVLQEREFERVGGNKTIKANIHILAATNKDLEIEVKTGNFRQDLFYRLNVVRLLMPSLRERKEDILLLAESFVEKFSRKMNRRIRGISAKAKKILLDYLFPGNVRELENIIERAIVLGENDWILPEDLPENLWESTVFIGDGNDLNYHEALQERKKELIFEAFSEANGSYVETAKLLEVDSNYLHRLIRNLGIKDELERLFKAKFL